MRPPSGRDLGQRRARTQTSSARAPTRLWLPSPARRADAASPDARDCTIYIFVFIERTTLTHYLLPIPTPRAVVGGAGAALLYCRGGLGVINETAFYKESPPEFLVTEIGVESGTGITIMVDSAVGQNELLHLLAKNKYVSVNSIQLNKTNVNETRAQESSSIMI
ncbi:hypothetical protein EVAR_57377_1 [Eumeta japonica]|uniref:Uncharacterized protein n=1 Tax=Eumeta variegata TaxID=151549 RepID=A0A4C1ZCF7_EUMVA|nr:hypothetical protein EVAR_57377_1 [Eumeta japonica]